MGEQHCLAGKVLANIAAAGVDPASIDRCTTASRNPYEAREESCSVKSAVNMDGPAVAAENLDSDQNP
jgi:hypothetical protein